jgi:hypothetical protein
MEGWKGGRVEGWKDGRTERRNSFVSFLSFLISAFRPSVRSFVRLFVRPFFLSAVFVILGLTVITTLTAGVICTAVFLNIKIESSALFRVFF